MIEKINTSIEEDIAINLAHKINELVDVGNTLTKEREALKNVIN